MSLTPAMKQMLLMLADTSDVSVALQFAQVIGRKAEQKRSAKTALALLDRKMLAIRIDGGLELTDAGRAAIAKLKAGSR